MRFFAILAIASFVVLLDSITAQQAVDPYCDPSLCKPGVKHIACENTGKPAAACSADAKLVPIDEPLRKRLQSRHNTLRNHVAGGNLAGFKKAVRMAYMKWSFSLAKLAEYTVLQCEMKHDACRNTAIYKNAGQNLAYSAWSGTQQSVVDVAVKQINSWYLEYKNTTMNDIDRFTNKPNGPVIGHYTQLMQGPSYAFGCAILRQTKDGMTEQYLNCNYGRTNFINQDVYESGPKTGAKCKTGMHKTYTNLCSDKEVYVL